MRCIITVREPFDAIDLNLLVTLDAVLDEKSVVRAARRLHVTPSAVSNALARLRAAVGDPLLVRHGRGVLPTPRAAALAPAIGRALRDLDQAIHGDSFDPATTERELRLAIADVFQVVKLPAIVAALAANMPRARLRVLSIDTLVASGGLGGTEVDVVIGAGDKGPGVHATPLYEERMVLVARAGHPALRGPRHASPSWRPCATSRFRSRRGRATSVWPPATPRPGITRDIAVVVPDLHRRRRRRGGDRPRRVTAGQPAGGRGPAAGLTPRPRPATGAGDDHQPAVARTHPPRCRFAGVPGAPAALTRRWSAQGAAVTLSTSIHGEPPLPEPVTG